MFVSGLDQARVDEEDIAGNPAFEGFQEKTSTKSL
jgi:hypothetical protein